MDDTELLDRLRLIRTNHIGPITCQLLLRRYGTPAAALQAIPELSTKGGRKLNYVRVILQKKSCSLSAMPALNCSVMVRNTILPRCCLLMMRLSS